MTPNELLLHCLRQTQPNPPPSTAAGRFAHALALLRSIIVNFGMANGPAGPFINALTQRLSRLAARFADLSRKFEAGTLPPLRPTARLTKRSPAAVARPPAVTAAVTAAFPSGFAWLQRWIPLTSYPRGMIEQVLADPDLPEFLAAAPQAGRVLRPLCHMLGIAPPPAVACPKPSARPRPNTPAAPRPAPRSPPPIPDHPIPGHPIPGHPIPGHPIPGHPGRIPRRPRAPLQTHRPDPPSLGPLAILATRLKRQLRTTLKSLHYDNEHPRPRPVPQAGTPVSRPPNAPRTSAAREFPIPCLILPQSGLTPPRPGSICPAFPGPRRCAPPPGPRAERRLGDVRD